MGSREREKEREKTLCCHHLIFHALNDCHLITRTSAFDVNKLCIFCPFPLLPLRLWKICSARTLFDIERATSRWADPESSGDTLHWYDNNDMSALWLWYMRAVAISNISTISSVYIQCYICTFETHHTTWSKFDFFLLFVDTFFYGYELLPVHFMSIILMSSLLVSL